MFSPILIVHGGAGDIKASAVPAKLAGVKNAVAQGFDKFLDGNSIDAVIAAVKVMENDPAFNCGRGSVLNLNGEIEMDAMLMDGATLAMGSVACVKNIEHPIELAQLVMNSPHTFLAGPGANEFAVKMNVPIVPAYRLVTDAAIKSLEDFLNNSKCLGSSEVGYGTVGAVALDKNGNVAAATSTGGITGKYVGRVGDSPLPGSGTYADNSLGAVSATGTGESIMRVCLAYRILSSMKNGLSAEEAVKEGLLYMEDTVGSTGGAITLSPSGDIGIHFISERMAWAYKKGSDEIQVGIDEPPSIS